MSHMTAEADAFARVAEANAAEMVLAGDTATAQWLQGRAISAAAAAAVISDVEGVRSGTRCTIRPRVPSDSAGLRVFNLPPLESAVLSQLFSLFGPLYEVQLREDNDERGVVGVNATNTAAGKRKRVDEPKLFAFVRYYCQEHAREAFDNLNGRVLFGSRRCRLALGIARLKSESREDQPLPLVKSIELVNVLLPLGFSTELVELKLADYSPAADGTHSCSYRCVVRLRLHHSNEHAEACALTSAVRSSRHDATAVAKKQAQGMALATAFGQLVLEVAPGWDSDAGRWSWQHPRCARPGALAFDDA